MLVAMSADLGYLPRLASRKDFIDYLNGSAPSAAAEAGQGKPRRRLIKTYMLETAHHHHPVPELRSIFPGHIDLRRLDETLYRIEDHKHENNVVGLLEVLNGRHPVLYTMLKSDISKAWVKQIVRRTPWLDSVWLSSCILFQLWKYVSDNTPMNRYVRLGFEHESLYDTLPEMESANQKSLEHDIAMTRDSKEVGYNAPEHRKTKVMLTEQVAVLKQKLEAMVDLYDPLHSLAQLQIPSLDRGGHMLYFDGHAINHSDSFTEHRATVKLVLRLYRNVTEHIENQLWMYADAIGEQGLAMNGAPLTIRFRQPLNERAFNRFVSLALERWNSRFRIGGYVTRRGPTKVHMVAVDRHLWQPLLLEATSRQLLAVLPHGTCGNTVHRLSPTCSVICVPVSVYGSAERGTNPRFPSRSRQSLDKLEQIAWQDGTS